MANVGQMARQQRISPGISPFLGWLPRALWRRAKDFFVYTAEFLPLSASATQTFEIAIQADSDFVIVAGVRVVTTTDNLTVQTFVPELVRILDTGSGRELTDRAVHIENWFGTAQLPAYWPYPKVIRASSTLQTTLQNLEANDRNARLSYLGFKVFDYPESG